MPPGVMPWKSFWNWNERMLVRLKSPFLADVFCIGLLLVGVTAWIGLGLVNDWPTYDGMAKSGGVTVATSLGTIGLSMAFLGLKPGWQD
jgi:hypothetical protein